MMLLITVNGVCRVSCVAASKVKDEEQDCSETEERLRTLVEDNTCKVK